MLLQRRSSINGRGVSLYDEFLVVTLDVDLNLDARDGRRNVIGDMYVCSAGRGLDV